MGNNYLPNENLVKAVQPAVVQQPATQVISTPEIDYKYNEAELLKEIGDYIAKTYNQHYSQNRFQTTEFLIDAGHGTGFCIGNIMKYAQRYGKKGSPTEWRKDLLKVIHYGIMMLYVHDTVNMEKLNDKD